MSLTQSEGAFSTLQPVSHNLLFVQTGSTQMKSLSRSAFSIMQDYCFGMSGRILLSRRVVILLSVLETMSSRKVSHLSLYNLQNTPLTSRCLINYLWGRRLSRGLPDLRRRFSIVAAGRSALGSHTISEVSSASPLRKRRWNPTNSFGTWSP